MGLFRGVRRGTGEVRGREGQRCGVLQHGEMSVRRGKTAKFYLFLRHVRRSERIDRLRVELDSSLWDRLPFCFKPFQTQVGSGRVLVLVYIEPRLYYSLHVNHLHVER